MKEDFLARLRPLIGEEGITKMQEPVIAIAGLGGVGSPAFLPLLRMGVKKFKIADNGSFNEPDINRQLGAFRSTMNRCKVDVYYDIAKDVNPDVEIERFREGLTLENLNRFIQGSDIFLRMFNHEKDLKLESVIPSLLKKHNCVCFASYLLGFGILNYNYKPGGLSIVEALTVLNKQAVGGLIGGLLPPLIVSFFSEPLMKRVVAYLEKTGEFPSNAPAAQLAGTLVASEVCNFLLQGTEVVTREVIWSPRFITFDLFTMEFRIRDVTALNL